MTAVREGALHLRIPVPDLTVSGRCPDCGIFTFTDPEYGHHWCEGCDGCWSHLGTHGWRPPELSTVRATPDLL